MSETQTEMHDDANGADAVIKTHSQLVSRGKRKEAEILAGEMARKYPQHPGVLLYLADYYRKERRNEESYAFYEKVLAISPDNLEARRAVGVACTHQRHLSRARSLLSYMLKKGPHQDAAVLTALVTAHCEVQSYAEMYPYMETIVRDFPGIAAKNKKFRRQVKEMEARTARTKSILPRSAAFKKLGWAGAAIIALLGV
ncbi:MAG: hypothetical protein GY950_08785, partial [bacterium]|nr:hypothetical protein [bacterium]